MNWFQGKYAFFGPEMVDAHSFGTAQRNFLKILHNEWKQLVHKRNLVGGQIILINSKLCF